MADHVDQPDRDWMGKLVFTCPVTGMSVQHWLDDDDQSKPGDCYQSIVCQACARLHFVNRKSGRLLGQKEEQAVPSAPVGAQERGHLVSGTNPPPDPSPDAFCSSR